MSQENNLWEHAYAVRGSAYAPYSNFLVGAAVLADDGQVYVGCNVENVAYPQGTCAEAGAIAAMIAGGARQISEVVVVADGDMLISPCGGCRQKLREFCSDDVAIHFADLNGIQQTITMGDLMPASFGPEHLQGTPK
jgi:cytidine deaminase